MRCLCQFTSYGQSNSNLGFENGLKKDFFLNVENFQQLMPEVDLAGQNLSGNRISSKSKNANFLTKFFCMAKIFGFSPNEAISLK